MRDRYWDACKGIAILAVLVIHCTAFTDVPGDSARATFLVVVRQFVNFAVATFLGLSGLFAGFSRQPKDGAYIRARLYRLVSPYLLWSTISLTIYTPFHWGSLPLLAVDYVVGQGLRGIGYFVPLLSQMIVLTPLIDRIERLRIHVAMMVGLTAIGLAFSYTVGLHFIYPFSKLPYSILPFPVFYPLYHLGYLLAKRGVAGGGARPRALALAIVAAVLALACTLTETFLFYPSAPAFATSQVKATSISYALAMFAVMILAYPYGRRRSWPILGWLGQNSYTIYLTHLFFALPFFEVLRPQPWARPGTPVHVIVLLATSLVACAGSIAIARRILPVKWQPYILG